MNTTPITDYIPEDQWPAVSVMVEGFGEQTLPASDALAGTALVLHGQEGSTTQYTFHDATTLSWTSDGAPGAVGGTATYKAIEARDGIYLVNFVVGEGLDAQNTTFVYNKATGVATTGISTFFQKEGRTRSTTAFVHATTPEAKGTAAHERSTALVGKRIYYRYSEVEAYEHIYLAPGMFTWHCIRGGEQGVADTDRCMTFDVAEDLYLFFWTEKFLAVEAFLVVDLREQRSIGRMFGWDDPTDEPVTLPFNSRLSVLNDTTYPQDHHKH
jgi:hypothetical protein